MKLKELDGLYLKNKDIATKSFFTVPITVSSVNPTVTDIDGNIYHTIVIGTQRWIVENLKVTHYSDGTAIPNITNNVAWLADTTGAYCWYENDIGTYSEYGCLYNWFATTNVHNIAPVGWRVPSGDDLDILNLYLGGAAIAGGKMKETGLVHWNAPNTGATNSSGFFALGSGHRNDWDGDFRVIKETFLFWTTLDEGNPTYAHMGIITNDSAHCNNHYDAKVNGFSIRCMQGI